MEQGRAGQGKSEGRGKSSGEAGDFRLWFKVFGGCKGWLGMGGFGGW